MQKNSTEMVSLRAELDKFNGRMTFTAKTQQLDERGQLVESAHLRVALCH